MINIISLIINQVFFSHELDNISPYGVLVEVNGQNMHVYSMGEGEKTIVLLPGFGVPLPCADFGPLMRELSKDYTVVCIEYFGIGFSDKTELPRTNENYTEEIRTALALAGFSAPYVFGLSRIINPIVVSLVLSINEENGYVKKEIDDYVKFMNHVNNDTIIDQTYRLNENIVEYRGWQSELYSATCGLADAR